MTSAFFLCHIIAFVGCGALQSIVNPGSHQIVSCGLSEPCAIICNGNYSCQQNTFYFYNNDISLQCDQKYSCSDTIIYSINATSLQLTFNGINSFFRSSAFIKQNNQQINTACVGQHACTLSSFYYSGVNQSVSHSCSDYWSCFRCLISSIFVQQMVLNCLDASARHYSCYHVDLYTSSWPYSSTVINVDSSWAMNNYVYSQTGTDTLQIYCAGSCIHLGEFYLVHGIHLDKICRLNETQCQNMKYVNAFADYRTVCVDNDNLNNLQINYDKLVLYIAPHDAVTHITSTSNSEIIVICVASDVRVMSVCDNLLLDLSATQNGTVVADNVQFLNIIGPQLYFKRVNYRASGYSKHNNYYLNDTKFIQFKCAQTRRSGNCVLESNLYLGTNTAIDIECGVLSGCSDSNIYSLINPNDHSFSLRNMGWNIGCIPETTFSCVRLKIYFPIIWEQCSVPMDGNIITNCSMMPTVNPTVSPSVEPSMSPTMEPTAAPSESPSRNPSQTPSESPTAEPTVEPTQTPSSQPSVSPTSYPSVSPSSGPSVSPSSSPSSQPSVSPTGSTLSPSFDDNVEGSKATDVRVIMVSTITTCVIYLLL